MLTCDPGVDDAVALIVAASRADRPLRAVVAGAGNVAAPTAWRNAAGLVALLGLGVPVGVGARTATDGTPIHRGPSSHGPDGLAGTAHRLPVGGTPAIAGAPLVRGDVLATGPLTDVAGAVRAGHRVDRVVWMGGSVSDAPRPSDADEQTGAGTGTDPQVGAARRLAPPGSTAAGTVAEFNAAADLAALDTVLASPVDVAIVPIEITGLVTIRPGDLDRWRTGSPVSRFCAELVTRRLVAPRRTDRPFALHDPVAVVAALEPDLFEWSPRRLAPAIADPQSAGPDAAGPEAAGLDAAGPQSAGARPADAPPAGRLLVHAGPPNARLATAVDVGAVRERIVTAVAAAGR